MILGLALVLADAGRADAEYIQYTLRTTASGSLGGRDFADRSLLIVGYGDTSQIVSPSPGIFNLQLFANSVIIDGFPAASFELTGLVVGLDQDAGGVGFLYGPSLSPILGVASRGLASYDLATADGPFEGDTIFAPNPPLETTAGSLILLAPADRSEFSSSVVAGPAVPEPASLALAATGAAGVAGLARRRRRA